MIAENKRLGISPRLAGLITNLPPNDSWDLIMFRIRQQYINTSLAIWWKEEGQFKSTCGYRGKV
jgi:hypothetical protein